MTATPCCDPVLVEKYARFAVRVGANVQPGQALLINAPIGTADFARQCAREAYAAGAREVVVHYKDEQLERLRLQHAPEAVLDHQLPWVQDSYTGYIKQPGSACLLSIQSADPEIYTGLDAARVDRAARARAAAMREYRAYTMNSRVQWSIVALPSPAWSAKVFPGDAAAEQKLWQAIFAACRIDGGDVVENWRAPLAAMRRHAAWLNELQLDALHITSANGTDLTIGLPKHHIWGGGSECTPEGVEFLPNIPTEEVFTAPDCRRTEGIVYGTRPYVYHGSLIEGLWVRFANGRAVEYGAKKGGELLEMLLRTDEGACRLGEIALVPATSPVRRSGLLFYNTLFDENAACHIAFGRAYPTCVEGGGGMDDAALAAAGINTSDIHEDVMVGDADTCIDGLAADGGRVALFRDGVWAQ